MEIIKDYAVQMRGITKIFGHHKALDSVDLDVKKGETHAILGDNGAGKSTTLKVLCGILKPQRGNVTIDGLDVKKTGSRLFEGRLAMVPQNPQALFTEITVEEELLEALYYSKEALQRDGGKIMNIAHHESLDGHANAVKVRMKP